MYLVLLGALALLIGGIAVHNRTFSKPNEIEDFNLAPRSLILWILGLAGIFSLILRFWHLGHSDWWPTGDETLTGWGALELGRHWNWDLFETFGQIPTTLSRIFCWMIRWTHDPLWSLQFSTACLSSLSIFMGYKASRQFFPRTLSAVTALLIMFSYFPLWSARTGYMVSLNLLWEWTVFYFLGKFIYSAKPRAIQRNAVLLGLACGLGPLMSSSWPILVLLISFILVFNVCEENPFSLTSLISFSLALLVVLSPFLGLVWNGQFGQHFMKVSIWYQFSILKQLQLIGEYVSALFWRYPAGESVPPGQAFLNPILSSCLGLGILELPRLGKRGTILFIGLFLFMLPGFLTNNFEPLRMITALPLILVVSAWGLHSLVLNLRPDRRVFILILVLLVSSLVDIDRLYGTSLRWLSRQADSSAGKGEGQAAYDSLRSFISKQKPGYLFLLPIHSDPTYPNLPYSTYWMNAAWNPDIPLSNIHWAALFTDVHYLPFLERRFVSAQWEALPSSETVGKSRNILGLIPVTGENDQLFKKWRDFYGTLQDINWKETNLPNGTSHLEVVRSLLDFYPRVPDDPFLQSYFFEKLAYQYSWENTFYPMDTWTNWDHLSGTFKISFDESYQDAELCEKYGRLLAVAGKDAEAKGMLKKALSLSPGNPRLNDEMKQLGLEN